ncbi:MAG: hypothetical protein COA86_06760 [Kangiella sp.]|nr:MAG: hypothetical protein COA86_06760 [Kangiella sp.]
MIYTIILFAFVLFATQITHAKLKKGYEASEGNYRYHKLLIFISFFLLLTYLVIIASVINSTVKIPSIGNLNIFAFLLVIPAFIYQLYFLVYRFTKNRFPKSKWLHRFLIIILGMILSIVTSKYLDQYAMHLFSKSRVDLIEAITASLPFPCDFLNSYEDKNKITNVFNKAKELYFNKQLFVITFHGGSIDIDGSTIFYRSDINYWDIFHNDNSDKRQLLQDLTHGFSRCVYPNG